MDELTYDQFRRWVHLKTEDAFERWEGLRRVYEKYYEILYAVGNKYEGESRHETALRYIRQAEKTGSLGKAEFVPVSVGELELAAQKVVLETEVRDLRRESGEVSLQGPAAD